MPKYQVTLTYLITVDTHNEEDAEWWATCAVESDTSDYKDIKIERVDTWVDTYDPSADIASLWEMLGEYDKEDWEKKYNDLAEENRKKAEEKEREELEAQQRAEFDNYFSENKKEWNNPFIADGYFGKFKEAKTLPENKGKMSADILHELTKDDATAFKVAQPIVNLKGPNGGLTGADIDEAKINAIMGIKSE